MYGCAVPNEKTIILYQGEGGKGEIFRGGLKGGKGGRAKTFSRVFSPAVIYDRILGLVTDFQFDL